MVVSLSVFSAFTLKAQEFEGASNTGGSSTTALTAGLDLARHGQLDGAMKIFAQALTHDPANVALMNALGATYHLLGDFENATEYFLKCLAADPGFVTARKNLAITYFAAGQYDLARAELLKLRDSSVSPVGIADLFLGMIAEKKGAYQEAAALLTEAGTLLDHHPEGLLCLARAELQLNNLRKVQEALTDFEQAREVTASQKIQAAELYSLLAQAAQKAGDLTEAMQSLRRAAKLDPSKEDNYLDFVSICTDYDNYTLALEGAEVGLEHIPNSYRLLVQKGVALEGLGRIEDAEASLRQAAKLSKDHSIALLSLSIVQSHAGQLQDAESTLTSAIKEFPDNYYMHYQLGKVLLKLCEDESANPQFSTRAKQEFERAVRCNPAYADSYYQLAKVLQPASSKLAEQNYLKCLRLDPSHGPAEYALARLYISMGRRAAGQQLIDRFERQRQADKDKESKRPRIEVAQN